MVKKEPRNNLKTVMAGLKNASPMKTREFGEASVTFQKFLKVQQEFELEITEVAAKCGVNKDELKSLVADFFNAMGIGTDMAANAIKRGTK